MDPTRAWREQNRRSWNAATAVHNARKGDQAAWLRAGHSTLFPEERALLGDLTGLRVAHLCCNSGQDTLGLAQLGADALGVDISDEAIRFATALSRDAGLPARFLRADVLDWLDDDPGGWDVIFFSYGALGWLPDLARVLRGVASRLAPGGRLVVQEFHPIVWSIGPEGRFADAYFLDGPLHDPTGVSDYVGRSGDGLTPMGHVEGGAWENPEACVAFQWTVADLVQGVADAGLRVEILREQPWANGCSLVPGMTMDAERRWHLAEGLPKLPLMVGLVARRPGSPR
ncbi:MAG TPA: class I SAM-dependent methyltransferase [Myxococcota bacterium]|nr:class I SAM-dependent methyltransferase [Myxococcota bacterium]